MRREMVTTRLAVEENIARLEAEKQLRTLAEQQVSEEHHVHNCLFPCVIRTSRRCTGHMRVLSTEYRMCVCVPVHVCEYSIVG